MDGAEQWKGALRNVENVQKAFGSQSTQIELVAHGKGIGMLLATTAATDPEVWSTVENLHASGVRFAVCQNTMAKLRISKDQLVPLATIVDSGVTEVIRKQEMGYSYIKSGS
jgi:intracellular sulfur oxidation DsrE/DsrF family protein